MLTLNYGIYRRHPSIIEKTFLPYLNQAKGQEVLVVVSKNKRAHGRTRAKRVELSTRLVVPSAEITRESDFTFVLPSSRYVESSDAEFFAYRFARIDVIHQNPWLLHEGNLVLDLQQVFQHNPDFYTSARIYANNEEVFDHFHMGSGDTLFDHVYFLAMKMLKQGVTEKMTAQYKKQVLPTAIPLIRRLCRLFEDFGEAKDDVETYGAKNPPSVTDGKLTWDTSRGKESIPLDEYLSRRKSELETIERNLRSELKRAISLRLGELGLVVNLNDGSSSPRLVNLNWFLDTPIFSALGFPDVRSL